MQVKIGEKIKDLRKAKGRKQEDLANALGVTPQAVSRWEANGGYPDMEIIPSIANYFHISIDELFGYNNDRNRIIQRYNDEAQQMLNNSDEHFTSSLLRSVDLSGHKVTVCEPSFLKKTANSFPEEEKKLLTENPKYSCIFDH